MQNYMIVCYYTDDEIYNPLVDKLRNDLKTLNLVHYIKKIPRLGNWDKCAKYRPQFLLDCLDKFNRPILSIDADARIYKEPKMIDKLKDYDFGYHLFRDKECFLGTFFVNNTEAAKETLIEWNKECKIQKKRSGLVFTSMMKEPQYNNLRIFNIPPEYAKIFDLMSYVKDPIIEHLQASRKARKLWIIA